MFINKTNEDEFFAALEGGMNKIASFDKNIYNDQKTEALNCLRSAAELLTSAGLIKEAHMASVLKEMCEPDEFTDGLTSEQMLKNLEEKGWVFNADDVDFEDEEEIEVEEKDYL